MRQRKFIITKDYSGKDVRIILGYPIYHKDLLPNDKNIVCCGGGKWHIDTNDKTIHLYGHSDDFGQPDKNDVKNAIKSFNDDDWFKFSWICEGIYDDEIDNEDWDNMKDNYKFVIDY